jgi:hypothetical protein
MDEVAMLRLLSGEVKPTAPLACSPLRPGVKIAQVMEETDAEHYALSLAELRCLPLGEESLETVEGEI